MNKNSVFEHSFLNLAICTYHFAKSMHFVITVLTIPDSSIFACVFIFTMHLMVLEIAVKMIVVCYVSTKPIQDIFLREFAVIKNIGFTIVVESTDPTYFGELIVSIFDFNNFFDRSYPEIMVKL